MPVPTHRHTAREKVVNCQVDYSFLPEDLQITFEAQIIDFVFHFSSTTKVQTKLK